VSWPAGIKGRGEIRTQYAHAIDMVPTVLDTLGIDPPASIKGVTQSPLEGVSFAHSFEDPDAPSKRRTQYFEMMGHRSIYQDGWRAVCPWPGPSFAEAGMPFGTPIPYEKLTELDAGHWELYHVDEDFAENHDVAADHRDKLIELIGQWYVEAGKYNVLPVDGRGIQRFAEERPVIAVDRETYTFYPGTQSVATNATVNLLNRSHSITASVEVPAGGADGVLLCQGGIDSGYSFYLKDGRLKWCHNYVDKERYYVESADPVPAGEHELRFEFEVTSPPDLANGRGSAGRAQLYVDGELVGVAEVPVTTPLALGLTSGVLCGRATGAPVTPDYAPPAEFTGKLLKVVVDVSGRLIEDDEAKMRMLMARQ
jgi:hypothetical protein